MLSFALNLLFRYVLGFKNPTLPYGPEEIENRGLCQAATGTLSFCPAVDNALMVPVVEWKIDFGDAILSHAVLANGGRLEPFRTSQCSIRCPAAPEVTAYIGGEDSLPLGLKADPLPDFNITESPTPATTEEATTDSEDPTDDSGAMQMLSLATSPLTLLIALAFVC